MKIHITKETLERLAETAREEIAAGFEEKEEAEKTEKIADELGLAKFDAQGQLTLSRAAFDWVVAELDWIASDYFNNRGGYAGDTEKVELTESEKKRIAWAYDCTKNGKEYAREGSYGSAVYFHESAARYLLDVLSKRFPEVEEIKKGGAQ